MKLLAIGDFHGEWPKKFEKIIKKEKIDIVVSNGDYFPFHYRKLWFKYCYGTDIELWEVVGKKKFKEIIIKDLKMGEYSLKKLDNLPVPVITVIGNIDYTRKNDVMDLKKPKGNKYWAWDWQDFFTPILKKYKNIRRFDYSYLKFGDYVFIGMNGMSFPGKPKSKAYRKSQKKLSKFFRRAKREDKEVIFVSHNVPYRTKLDKIGKNAHKKVAGKHYGSKLAKWAIKKYNPLFFFGGHIHEGIGMQKIGRTLCVNPGSAHEGHAAVIEIGKNNKLHVRLI